MAYIIDADLLDASEISEEILDRATQARLYASEAFEMVEVLSAAISTDMSAYDPVDASTIFNVECSGIAGINLSDPTYEGTADITVREPNDEIGTRPEMSDIIMDVIGDVPTFDGIRPNINMPTPPTDDWPAFNDDAPLIPDSDLPTKPDQPLPAVPDIGTFTIPAPPEYNPASFDGVKPVADLTPPENVFAHNEAEYNTDLKEKLASDLYDQLIEGGTGLDADTEQAIWDRAYARQQEENEKAYQEALNFHASRGFSLPEGVLNSTLIETNNRINQRRDDLNNDILVQQSKLAQENTHFIIDRAIAFEKNLMDHFNQVQNRAFEAAKAVVQLANEVYRIKVEGYMAQLEVYKVEAQVFESMIRAEIAKAEFYKAQIEGVKAGVEVKSLLVQAYVAQVDGIKTLIQLYATEMEAAKIKSDIDLNRLEAFKTKAQVFGIKTEALTAQYSAYAAQIAGETEKVKMYEADARAYAAKVDGFKAAADVEMTKAQIQLEEHKGNIETYKAAIDKYKADSDRMIAQANAEATIEGVKIEKYKGDVSKYQADVEALIRSCLARIEKVKAEAEILVKDKEIAIHQMLTEKGLKTEVLSTQAKIGAQLAAAALTSVSASTSLGLSMSENQSKSRSDSVSFDATKGIASNHNTHQSDTKL